MIYFLMMKGCPDALATFNYKKQLIACGCIGEGAIFHLMNNPTDKAASELFLVPSESRGMPTTCNDQHIMTLQQFLDLKVISQVSRCGQRLPNSTKAKVIQLRAQGCSIRKVAAICDVAESTVQRISKSA